MSHRNRASWATRMVLGVLTIGGIVLTCSVYVIARLLQRVGSNLLGHFFAQAVVSLMTVAYLIAALEIANAVILWATRGFIPSLIHVAWRISAWSGP